MIECDEVMSLMDMVSTKMTNTMATNVTKNCHNKKQDINLIFCIEFYKWLLYPEKCLAIYNRIGYLISPKSSITYNFSHYYAKIKVDSCSSLPVEEWFTLHNVIILTESFNNKSKNHY